MGVARHEFGMLKRAAPYQFVSATLALLWVFDAAAAGPDATWRRRQRPKEAKLGDTGWSVADLTVWPEEPPSPPADALDVGRLDAALRAMCPRLGAERGSEYAALIIRYSRQFDVDAMLLAALVYQQGRCRRRGTHYGVGLTRIHVGMHRSHWNQADRTYSYWLPAADGTAWERKSLALPDFPFNRWSARKPDAGLYFSAAVMAIYGAQCPHIDDAHGASAPHRSPVSHFIWGDRVRSSHEESEVLIARRRVIRHYTGVASPLRGAFRGRPLVSPLEGPPRKLTGGWGDPRGPRRRHKGVDFSSTMAEPVRAIADGVVWIAGADMADKPTMSLRPDRAQRLSRGALGRAGLIVLLDHGGGLTSGYMHLLKYTVRTHQRVKAGQVIGYVGRTGVKSSSAHLHFEIRVDRQRVDALPLLGPLVISHLDTKAGRWRQARWDRENKKLERERRRAANARWRERRAKKAAARKSRD